ncbi:polysaccharide deacetylase family protein [Taibaiella soli]|uniref:Polysaccharide deacetylase family protein n=1 Tax=Taibaiella soli TaxID=1649169 RepID=A0A2W2AGK2_9BACT|nr:polysaccharide deacetylase family protein [Taibaiella soli]PZF71390.1 polysaccharide deacetylase family protein [Taibaiella soli]
MAFVKMPWYLKILFPRGLTWKIPKGNKPTVYLTFDDGPHPTITPFVLDRLQQHDAKATFFCIGKNVVEHPEVYQRILDEGHTVGNHTQNHKNGWKTDTDEYIRNIIEAAKHIDSKLFRPPYGRIKYPQAKFLLQANPPWKIIMWGVLSEDYDQQITPEQCLKNVLMHIEPGSIVVFHDSEKAWDRLSYALPRVLQFCKEKNWTTGLL